MNRKITGKAIAKKCEKSSNKISCSGIKAADRGTWVIKKREHRLL